MTRRQRSHEIGRRLRKSLHGLRITRYVIQILGARFSMLSNFLTQIAGEVNVVSFSRIPIIQCDYV